MSEEDTQALNPTAEEEVSDSTPPVEEPKATEEPDEVDQPTEEESGSKKGANQRIRQLNQRAKSAEEKVESLQERVNSLTGQPVPGFNPQIPDEVEPIARDGEELTAAELEKRLKIRDQRILKQAAQSNQFAIQRQTAINNIQRETNEVIALYPQLDPDNQDFNSDISDAITEATEAYIKANPTGSVKKYVNRLMKPYGQSVTKAVANQQKEIAKQAVETAIRPTTGITKQDKQFQDLSIKEMEEKLGMIAA